MHSDSPSLDTPIFTIGDYRKGVERWNNAVDEIKQLLVVLDDLEPVLSAIETISPSIKANRFQRPIGSEVKARDQSPQAKPSLRQRMLEALDGHPEGLGGAQLHRKLKGNGIHTSINYVYSTLYKLKEKGDLFQNSEKAYRLKKYRNSDFSANSEKKDLFESGGADA